MTTSKRERGVATPKRPPRPRWGRTRNDFGHLIRFDSISARGRERIRHLNRALRLRRARNRRANESRRLNRRG